MSGLIHRQWWLVLLCAIAAVSAFAQERQPRQEVTWQCPFGYHWSGETCERLSLPPGAHFDKSAEAGWACNRGLLQVERRCVRAHLNLYTLEITPYSSDRIRRGPFQAGRRKVGSTVEIQLYGSAVDYAPGAGPVDSSSRRGVAENGSYHGQISAETGRPKTVRVGGYTRKDGTRVRGHYRSKPQSQ